MPCDPIKARAWYCSTKHALLTGNTLVLHHISPYLNPREVSYILDSIAPVQPDIHIVNYAHPHQIHSNDHSFKFQFRNTPRNLLTGVPAMDLIAESHFYANKALMSNSVIVGGTKVHITETYREDIVALSSMHLQQHKKCLYDP